MNVILIVGGLILLGAIIFKLAYERGYRSGLADGEEARNRWLQSMDRHPPRRGAIGSARVRSANIRREAPKA